MKMNKNQIEEIVYQAAKALMSEGVFTDDMYQEGKPQKASDVFKSNGWTGKTVSKDTNCIVVRCYTNASAFHQPLEFEELVEDLNIFYQDSGKPLVAQGLEEFNGEQGSFIKVCRK